MNVARKKYIVPLVELIRLDKAISLHLESEPPVGPEESFNIKGFPNADPVKLLNEA